MILKSEFECNDSLQSGFVVVIEEDNAVPFAFSDFIDLSKVLSDDVECKTVYRFIFKGENFNHGLCNLVLFKLSHRFYFFLVDL